MERPADGASVDRLPEPIQDKHRMFEYGIHYFPSPIAGKLAKPAQGATEKATESETNLPPAMSYKCAVIRSSFNCDFISPPSLTVRHLRLMIVQVAWVA
jgi:hypothetical protein